MPITIHQPKISPKHNDSFWYEGLIAEGQDKNNDTFQLVAYGEIKLINEKNGELIHDGSKLRNDGVKLKLENDEDLQNLLQNGFIFDSNNWFEIIDKNNFGEVIDTYDEAINLLTLTCK